MSLQNKSHDDWPNFIIKNSLKTIFIQMFTQSMHNSNYPTDYGFSSSKKKATTPALLFFKSNKDSSSKVLT